MKIIKKLFLLILLLLLALIIFAFGYYFAVTRRISLNPEKLLFSEKTITFYDEKGEPIRGASTPFFKQTISIEAIPTHTKQAFIDTEDKRFYRHNGYDVKRILRASVNNLKSLSFKEGASTISQQLIKNTHLSQEKTLKRKLQEWKLTGELEKKYSKEEILEKYLNTIYFGHSCFGITSAAEFYFGKTPSELTLADSAILAGLVKSPNNYSPFQAPANCKRRKATVLNAMERNGSISQEEKSAALSVPLPEATKHKRDCGYFHSVFEELTEISEKNNFKIGGKLEIYTYLDQDVQSAVEKIAETHTESDKTIIVLNGKNQGFKACVSTVGKIKRLPGSLIKPLLVYAPALEENIISPATPILDERIDYNGYAPENYDNLFHGYVSARECVEKSLNIPAVKTLETLTLKKATTYLENLGLPVPETDNSLALALGGMKEGYSLQALVAAYAALQNEGVFQPTGFISAVKINDITVYTKPTTKKRVFSEDTAYLMSDILKGVAQKGTAKKLRALPFALAAKTGTVGTKNGNTDAYALSYTPLDCAAVWLGNADNSKIDYTGGGAPCSILSSVNKALYALYQKNGQSIPDFSQSKNVRKIDLDKTAYYDTHTLCLADKYAPESERFSELFKKSAIPLNTSTSFSNPTIIPPELTLCDGAVKITFDKHSPTYYTYKIDRYDYVTHTTVYEGEFIPIFTDQTLSENKNYVYTIIPIYKENIGKPIVLPTVTTKSGEPPKLNDREILSKNWWEY